MTTRRGDVLPADLVAVGIGVAPDLRFLAGSGITLENGGITVNEYLEASAPGVYAAGDVARFFDPLYGRHRRIEHWDTAIQHGKVAGANLAGERTAYAAVSMFYSDVFDLTFEYFGDAEGTTDTVRRGSFAEKSVSLFFLQDRVVRAAFTLGRPTERSSLIALIKQRVRVNAPEVLADPSARLPNG